MLFGKETRLASFQSAVTIVPLTLLLLLFVSSPDVDACSMPLGWRHKSLTEKVLEASELLYGRVRRTFPDPRFDYGSGTTAYTAEMEIYCALKGRRPDRIVNITEAGHIPGYCHSSNLTVGNDFVIMARYDDEKYHITSVQIDVTEDNLRQITKACGLQRTYPNGVEQSTTSVQCPVLTPPGECKTMDDFTASPSAKPTDYDYDTGANVVKPPGSKIEPHEQAVIGNNSPAKATSATGVALFVVTLCGRLLFTF